SHRPARRLVWLRVARDGRERKAGGGRRPDALSLILGRQRPERQRMILVLAVDGPGKAVSEDAGDDFRPAVEGPHEYRAILAGAGGVPPVKQRFLMQLQLL